MRKSKKRYYAVVGANAVMVADTYDRACFCRDRYFLGPKLIYGFRCMTGAEEHALQHIWYTAPLDRKLPEHLEMNKVYAFSGLERL